MPGLQENYRRVLDRISEAALGAGRRPDQVRLIGVTKCVAPDRVREAIELGLRDIGENRVQEAEEKMRSLGGLDVRCHFIGHLQSNKARRAVAVCTSIESVDSTHLARRLDGIVDRPFSVFIQVRTGDEATKSGVDASELRELVECVRGSRWLKLEGLMTIPPFFEHPEQVRPYFARLRELGYEYDVPGLSMGMSHDFHIAIEEGATQVRIGTALFGQRS